MTDRVGTDEDPALNRETQWQQVVQRLYEPAGDSGLATDIVLAIAKARGVSPKEVKSPPLYEVVDVAGIEAAFFGSNNRDTARQGTGTVEFHYTEHLVKVKSDGWIQVYEPSEAT